MVLVTGAGPVGLTLAMSLARRGVPVRIVDRNGGRTDKSKALVIWPRTLELLDIQGCAGEFIAAGIEGHGTRMHANGKELLQVHFDLARSPYRYALLIPQSETERVLEGQLATLGVTVERETELVSFEQDEGGVDAVLNKSGREERVRVPWLAGCDGAHSVVRDGIGASFEGTTMPSDWVLGDVRIDGKLAHDEIDICWTDAGVLALFPIVGNRFRIIADVGASIAGPPASPTLPQLQALLDTRGPPGLKAHDPVWVSGFRINERKVRDYSHGRVFLAGDAAHIHSPAGGQGMNTGMHDAVNLAWKLALVVNGPARPSLLDSYSPERSAIGTQVLHNAARLTEIGITHNPLLRGLRDLAAETLGHLHVVQQKIVDQLTEVDLHYADSPLTIVAHGHARRPAPGERAPDVPLADGSRLHEALRGGRFVVLAVGVAAPTLPVALEGLAQSAAAAPNDSYDAGHLYLVRPDAYVAQSTGIDGLDSITQALGRLCA